MADCGTAFGTESIREKVEVEASIEDEYDSKNDSAKPRMLSTGECCEAGISPQQSAGLDESCKGLMSCDDLCDPCEVFNEVLLWLFGRERQRKGSQLSDR